MKEKNNNTDKNMKDFAKECKFIIIKWTSEIGKSIISVVEIAVDRFNSILNTEHSSKLEEKLIETTHIEEREK